MRVTISVSSVMQNGLHLQEWIDQLRTKLNSLLPCNCGHWAPDHELKLKGSGVEPRHCNGYGRGTCACDYFTEMDNLAFVQWVDEQYKNRQK
jgi:hypothetical protein